MERKDMEEKAKIWMMAGVSTLVLLVGAMMIVLTDGANAWPIIAFLVVAILAVVALFIVSRAMKDVRSGIPLQDERSRALRGRASHFSFYVSLYLVLALAVVFIALEDRGIQISNSELLFAVVVIMGSIHIAFSTYYNRKGMKALE